METAVLEKRRLRPVRALTLIIIALLIAAALFAGGFLLGRSAQFGAAAPAPDPVVLQNKLSEAAELVSVDYVYTNMAQFENSAEFYGVKIPFTTKSFFLTYDGVIKAGVDLSLAQVKVSGSSVTVTLPPAGIISHEIDQDSIKILDEKTSIFNPFTVDDYSAFCVDQKAQMELTALGEGILDSAKRSAAGTVRLLLSSALPEDYELVVK